MDPVLAFAAELVRRDEALAEQLELLLELGRRVDEIRAAAERTRDTLELLPREQERLDATLVAAEREQAAAETELAEARRAVERARSEDAQTSSRRRETAASAAARTAAERRARLVARRGELDRERKDAEGEIRALEAQGGELAGELAAAPRVADPPSPSAGLDGLVDWGSRAHAAVFLARSGLETERERVVREANELAASVLGEPLYATSVAAVRERIGERLS